MSIAAYLPNYENLSSFLKPYATDISVALVFAVGYYVFKYLNTNPRPVTKEYKKTGKVKSSKWDQANTVQIYNGLILQNQDPLVDAYKILTKMHENKVAPDITSYNRLIDMSFRFEQDDNALKLFDEVCDSFSGVNPDIVTFNILLKHYVKEIKDFRKYQNITNEKKLEKVFKIFSEIKTRDIPLNEITFNTAMDACVEVGDFERTWGLFEELKTINLVPDLYTYATLVKGLKNSKCADNVQKAIEILELVKSGACSEVKADEVLYNSVLDICIRNNKVDLAEKIFEEMKEGQVKPSVVTYSIMIRGYGVIQNIRKAFELYEEIKSLNLKPNDIIYGCLMNCAVRCSNLELMVEIYEKMKAMSMKPNSIIYTTLIKGFNKMHKYEKSFEIFDQLTKEEKEKSNIILFNAILDVCVESGNYERLNQIYKELKQEASVNDNFPKPNVVTFSTVIKGYIKNQKFDDAISVYEFLKSNGYKLDEIIYSIMIDGLAENGLTEKAEEIFREMKRLGVKRSSIIYSILIKMYAKTSLKNDNDIPKAVGLIQLMKEDGIKPTVISFTTIMQMYLRKKQIRDAINVFDEMKKDGLEPDVVSYNFIINGCTFNQNLEWAIKFLLESLEKNMKLNPETYKNTLEYLLNNKFMKYQERVKNASLILNGLKLRNIEVNYDLYSRVMRLIFKNNEGATSKKIETNIKQNFANFTDIFRKNC